MRRAIASLLALGLASVSVPAMSERAGSDREILFELRRINDNLEQIIKKLDDGQGMLRSTPGGSEGERIFQELNEMLRRQETAPQIYNPNDPSEDFR